MKLLEAALSLEERAEATSVKSTSEPAVTHRGSGGEAENRQLTVMFCDLVGSTALSQRLDAESLREVINDCQQAWADPIQQYDGYIARYMGDGVMVYFGYPVAHEDDAERAVRAGDDSHSRLSYQCSPFHVNDPLHPVVVGLTQAAHIDPSDRVERKLEKLEAYLRAQPRDLDVVMRLFADLLSIPLGDRYHSLDLTPQQHKQKTQEVLIDRLVQLESSAPVVMVFEDLHWIDPTTQELVDLVVTAAKRLRVLLVATFRPEYQAPWTGQPNTTLIQLSRVSHRDGVDIARGVPGADTLSEDVIATIVDKTDGIPLFLEELTRTVIDGGSNATSSVPASLHASLLARLSKERKRFSTDCLEHQCRLLVAPPSYHVIIT